MFNTEYTNYSVRTKVSGRKCFAGRKRSAIETPSFVGKFNVLYVKGCKLQDKISFQKEARTFRLRHKVIFVKAESVLLKSSPNFFVCSFEKSIISISI